MIEKAKNQKNIDVVLSGFVGNKDNSDVDSKIFHTKSFFEPTTAEKDSKKIMEIINRLFYTSDINKLISNYWNNKIF